MGAILNAAGKIFEITAAVSAKSIQGAITKQAVKTLRVSPLMAREKLAVPIAEIGKIICLIHEDHLMIEF